MLKPPAILDLLLIITGITVSDSDFPLFMACAVAAVIAGGLECCLNQPCCNGLHLRSVLRVRGNHE
jgi:hypothetical protein